MELPPPSGEHEGRVERPVARREPPHAVGVAAPSAWIRRGVGAMRERGAPRVLEVVDAARARVRVLNAAEVEPHVRVLVAEQRPEKHVPLSLNSIPPLRPGPP